MLAKKAAYHIVVPDAETRALYSLVGDNFFQERQGKRPRVAFA
jgi:hypothetical protein